MRASRHSFCLYRAKMQTRQLPFPATVKNISADGIFIAIGSVPSTGFLVNSDIKNENGYLTVEGNSTRTSIDGVFAAGDASDSVYKQAVVAASMGCKAAIDVQSYLAVSSEQF